MSNIWDKTIEIKEALVSELILSQFKLKTSVIKSLGEGYDNTAFLVNDKFVFRFVHREQLSPTCMANEITLLPYLFIEHFLKGIVFQKYKAAIIDPNIENKRALKAYQKAGFKNFSVEKSNKYNETIQLMICHHKSMLNTENVQIDVSLVRKLIETQYPQWKELTVKPVEFSGWDNRSFHLGDHMIVRLPSAVCYSTQAEKEQHWLPKIAPFLPLPIPAAIAMGKPTEEYPWHWSINRWLDGQTASIERIKDLRQFAISLAEFLVALQQCDATDGPLAGEHSFYRGGELSTYDGETREAIAALDDKIVAEAIAAVWDEALASTWQRPPVWIHGDIAIGNLLVQNGELSAVIDFGQLAIGDPACDLAIAWTLFTEESRQSFRDVLKLDKGTWARGRGWTLWKALCWAFPGRKEIDWRVVNEVLADHEKER